MTEYTLAPPDAVEMMKDLMAAFHPKLAQADVKIDLLFAFGEYNEEGELKSPPLKKDGYPCAGLTRKLAHKCRVAGRGDVEILIDGNRWTDEWSEEEKRALLDHELTHIQVKDEVDPGGRPEIAMRKHDWQFGWFDSVAQRHGGASFEVKQIREWLENARQMWLPFDGEPEAQVEEAIGEVQKLTESVA